MQAVAQSSLFARASAPAARAVGKSATSGTQRAAFGLAMPKIALKRVSRPAAASAGPVVASLAALPAIPAPVYGLLAANWLTWAVADLVAPITMSLSFTPGVAVTPLAAALFRFAGGQCVMMAAAYCALLTTTATKGLPTRAFARIALALAASAGLKIALLQRALASGLLKANTVNEIALATAAVELGLGLYAYAQKTESVSTAAGDVASLVEPATATPLASAFTVATYSLLGWAVALNAFPEVTASIFIVGTPVALSKLYMGVNGFLIVVPAAAAAVLRTAAASGTLAAKKPLALGLAAFSAIHLLLTVAGVAGGLFTPWFLLNTLTMGVTVAAALAAAQ